MSNWREEFTTQHGITPEQYVGPSLPGDREAVHICDDDCGHADDTEEAAQIKREYTTEGQALTAALTFAITGARDAGIPDGLIESTFNRLMEEL